MSTIDHLLSPEEVITLFILGRPANSKLATSAASANDGRLGLPAIFLGKVGRLQRWIGVLERELLQLEAVYTCCANERQKQKGRKDGEDHGGWW